MFLGALLIVVGLAGLIWGGDKFVRGAAAFARNLGVSSLLIGLTIVAFGTSAPEIFVSIVASIKGNPGIAVGNAIGSNITNVGLVIGLTAILIPIRINSGVIKYEFPVLLLIMTAVLVLIWDGRLTRVDGVVMLLGMVVLVYWFCVMGAKRKTTDILAQEYEQEIPAHMPTRTAVIWIIIGCILLPVSSAIFVEGAILIAKILSVSDTIIGLTIAAIGTSLPELFASLMGAWRNEPDIALGNVLGSNMFNLLAVLGFPGLIHPTWIDGAIYTRDYPVMVLLTITLYIMCIGKKREIGRVKGSVLLIAYISYLSYLVFSVI